MSKFSEGTCPDLLKSLMSSALACPINLLPVLEVYIPPPPMKNSGFGPEVCFGFVKSLGRKSTWITHYKFLLNRKLKSR